MPSIPHSFVSAVIAYAAPLAAFLIALALPLAARGKVWTVAAAPLALFVGWALLHRLAVLPRAVWAPHRGTETLLAPALACAVGLATVAWRGGRQKRLTATAMGLFAGWWVARDGAGLAEFWRVWVAVAVLAALASRAMQGRAERSVALAVALWGGLTVAGAGPEWQLAALVAALCAAGLAASGAGAAVPSAAVAALMGAVELADGRLLRGRLDPVAIACLAALAAPFVAQAAASRVPRRVSVVLSPVIGAAGAAAAVWLVRRAFFT